MVPGDGLLLPAGRARTGVSLPAGAGYDGCRRRLRTFRRNRKRLSPDGGRPGGGLPSLPRRTKAQRSIAMSLFSFFKRKARPAKKDFDWFFARLLSQAGEAGWNDGYPLPDVDLVFLAEKTSLQFGRTSARHAGRQA